MRNNIRERDAELLFKKSNQRNHQAAETTGTRIYEANRYSFFGCVVSDTGRIRPQNEDNYLFLGQHHPTSQIHSQLSGPDRVTVPKWQLAAVFDGISSTRSACAAAEAAQQFQNVLSEFNASTDIHSAESIVRRAFLRANDRILQNNMGGTTATVLCLNQNVFKFFQLGDSRAYLYRNKKLLQLTRDQTLKQLKLDAGLYDPSDIESTADSHILTDYLGRDRGGIPAESHWLPIQDGDLILLCSDGLYNLCTDEEIAKALDSVPGQEKQAQILVEAARDAGGLDNITCMVIRFDEIKKGRYEHGHI